MEDDSVYQKTSEERPEPRGRRFVPRTRFVGSLLFAAAAVFAGISLSTRMLGAAGGPSLGVNPASVTQLWSQPTPFTITINASSFSGPGLTPVTGYQYGLTWNPNVLRWVSGPKVGAGTPTPAPLLSCSNSPQIKTWGTATATPTGVLTWTPTSTPTPLTTTPTNTPTVTFTPSMTPTPGGYIFVGCVTLSGTAQPSGVVGTFTFMPIATGPAGSSLTLRDVMATNNQATALPVTTSNGFVSLVGCGDINGDGIVNGLDLGTLAAHFLTSTGNPNYLLAADLNKDGTINGLDLGALAGSFLLSCTRT